MHETNYTDRLFKPDSASVYSLSVQANSGGLTYIVSDNISERIVLFHKYHFDQVILLSDLIKEVGEILDTDSILGLQFSNVRFLGYSRQTTLVPEPFFAEDQVKAYLSFSDADESVGTVFSNKITPGGIYNIFSLPSELVAQVNYYFKKAEFLGQTTTFLKHVAASSDNFTTRSVYAGLNPDFFDIACTDNGKLLLYNTFQYANETDLLYYILFVYKCMHFTPEHVPLVISGEQSSRLSYQDTLRQYFSQNFRESKFLVSREQDQKTPVLAPGLFQLNATGFLNLLNVNLCESSVENTKEGK